MSRMGASPERTPQRLPEMEARERRRAVTETAVRSVVAFGVVLGAYFLLPVGEWGADGLSWIRLVGGLVLFGVILAWQVRRISRSAVPSLQAIEALIVAIPTFIAVYAGAYVSFEVASPGSFTQPIDKAAALYFTIVTLGTVGFGDIAPVSTAARLAVSSQVMLDLVLIAVVVRLLMDTARRTLGRTSGPPEGH